MRVGARRSVWPASHAVHCARSKSKSSPVFDRTAADVTFWHRMIATGHTTRAPPLVASVALPPWPWRRDLALQRSMTSLASDPSHGWSFMPWQLRGTRTDSSGPVWEIHCLPFTLTNLPVPATVSGCRCCSTRLCIHFMPYDHVSETCK